MDEDEPYQVPLREFIATRDDVAARLKAAGHKEAASALKSARKPSVPAWAANQVVWRAPEEWRRLREAARVLRSAHQKPTPPEDMRQAIREQREALSACEARAARMLAQHEHAVTPAVLEKVGHTLLALAYGAPDLTPGRLEHELQPPGFEALAGLTLVAPKPRPTATAPEEPEPSAPRRTIREGPDTRAAEERRRADERRKAEEQEHARRAALKSAEARHTESRRAALKARARLDAEDERRRALEEQLEAARHAADDARRELQAAEAEEAAAQAALDALRSG